MSTCSKKFQNHIDSLHFFDDNFSEKGRLLQWIVMLKCSYKGDYKDKNLKKEDVVAFFSISQI